MTNTSITTTENLLSAIYTSTSHGVTRVDSPDGVTTFRNGDRLFAIGEEFEADGETLWGWIWDTGVYETFGDREIMEDLSTDAGQDASEALAAAVRHLGPIEDHR